jgi:hypothetical protein
MPVKRTASPRATPVTIQVESVGATRIDAGGGVSAVAARASSTARQW